MSSSISLVTLEGFSSELVKISVKVPFIHGTAGKWPVLKPGIGSSILKSDPNPRAVYTAMANRTKTPPISDFAHKAVKARGGEPVIARGKMDTKKGWAPMSLSAAGKRELGSVDDAKDLIRELDSGAQEPRRGEIWRTLHRTTGAWRNEAPAATLKTRKYVPAT